MQKLSDYTAEEINAVKIALELDDVSDDELLLWVDTFAGHAAILSFHVRQLGRSISDVVQGLVGPRS